LPPILSDDENVDFFFLKLVLPLQKARHQKAQRTMLLMMPEASGGVVLGDISNLKHHSVVSLLKREPTPTKKRKPPLLESAAASSAASASSASSSSSLEEDMELVAAWMDAEDDALVTGLCDDCDGQFTVVDVCGLCGREFCPRCWDSRMDADVDYESQHNLNQICSNCVVTQLAGDKVLKL